MRLRTLLILAAALVLGFAVSAAITLRSQPLPQPQAAAGASAPGGPFRMIDQNRAPVTEAALKGRPTVMFFGFTYCPDICPTTLSDVTRWMKALGPRANRLNVVFVSVDPERDTPAQLKSYLTSFDPRIRGFTGSADQVAAMTKAYKVYAQKIPLEGGSYTMDHSSTLFLFDADGGFVELIPYGSPDAEALPKIERLLS